MRTWVGVAVAVSVACGTTQTGSTFDAGTDTAKEGGLPAECPSFQTCAGRDGEKGTCIWSACPDGSRETVMCVCGVFESGAPFWQCPPKKCGDECVGAGIGVSCMTAGKKCSGSPLGTPCQFMGGGWSFEGCTCNGSSFDCACCPTMGVGEGLTCTPMNFAKGCAAVEPSCDGGTTTRTCDCVNSAWKCSAGPQCDAGPG